MAKIDEDTKDINASVKRFMPLMRKLLGIGSQRVVDRLDTHNVERLIIEMPEYIEFMEEILKAAAQIGRGNDGDNT